MASVLRMPQRPSCPCGCFHPPGTPCPPVSCDPCAPSGSQLPRGVTDGSNALPGQVGEYFTAAATISYQGGTPLTTTIGVGTLPPGDWDAWAYMTINPSSDLFLSEVGFFLNPLPMGFQHPLGQAFTLTSGFAENFVPQGPIGRANTTVPTALVFQVGVTGTGSGSGTVTLNVSARRVR